MCDEAIAALRSRGVTHADVGLILGSGLGGACPPLHQRVKVSYAELPGARRPAVSGHAGHALWGLTHSREVLAFLGRVHLYEGATFDEVTFPIRLLASVGARVVVVTQAAGTASPWLRVPCLMLIRDQLNLTGRSFPAEPPRGPLYSRGLRSITRRAAFEQGIALQEGVLAGFLGPSYETAAEVRMARRAGAHALTMSTVPEIVAARSRGLDVVGLSVITNRAPHSGGEIQHETVVENASAGASTLRPLLETLISRLGS